MPHLCARVAIMSAGRRQLMYLSHQTTWVPCGLVLLGGECLFGTEAHYTEGCDLRLTPKAAIGY